MADPATVSGLTYRWRADSVTGSSGAAVSSWPALAGGAALAQSVSANQPTLQLAALGGQSAVRFDGTSDFLTTTVTSKVQPYTLVFVLKWNSLAGIEQVLDAVGAQLVIVPSSWDLWAGSDISGGTTTTSAPVVVTAVVNGASSAIYVNGTQVVSGNVGTGAVGTAYNVGRHSSLGRYAAMDLAETFLYAAALNATDRSTVHSYVKDRYGIAVSDYVATGGDTTAPTVPTNVTATASSSTSVVVSWAASTDNVGVASYRVLRSGATVAATVAGTSFTDTTVAPSTTYSYTVSAVDAAGNRSAESTAATATTPAGSVTASQARVNVKDFGVKGDGTTDDTAAINSAISQNQGRIIEFPPGVYMVNGAAHVGVYAGWKAGILMYTPQVTLEMSQGATLKLIPTTEEYHAIIQVADAQGCVIRGGTIIGDAATHAVQTAFGWGIDVERGAHNLLVESVTVREMWGDGVFVNGNAEDTVLRNVTSLYNARQGCSIIYSKRTRVEGGRYGLTGMLGADRHDDPSAGIDVEPDPNGQTVTDFLIEGVLFDGNLAQGLLVVTPPNQAVSGTVTNCRAVGNGASATSYNDNFRQHGAGQVAYVGNESINPVRGSGFGVFSFIGTAGQNCTYSSNISRGAPRYGFEVSDSSGVQLTGNVALNSSLGSILRGPGTVDRGNNWN